MLIYVRIYIYIYKYIYMNTYIYIYIYICIPSRGGGRAEPSFEIKRRTSGRCTPSGWGLCRTTPAVKWCQCVSGSSKDTFVL